MKESLKAAIINNAGRVLVAMSMMVLTWMVAPVKEIIQVPKTMRSMQADLEVRQTLIIKALANQARTDSTLLAQLASLSQSNNHIKTEVVVVQAKITAIRDAFPALHQRFDDIETGIKSLKIFDNSQFSIGMKPQS